MSVINKIALGGATIVVLAFFWLYLANAHLKADLADARADNAACRMANGAFAASVKKQNDAVERLKAARIKRADGEAQKFFDAAEKIRNMKTEGDACRIANELFNAYLSQNR